MKEYNLHDSGQFPARPLKRKHTWDLNPNDRAIIAGEDKEAKLKLLSKIYGRPISHKEVERILDALDNKRKTGFYN